MWRIRCYGRQIRVEHWDNAQSSGPAAAKAMLGQAVSYDHLPFFFTDQYDLGMEFTGVSTAPTRWSTAATGGPGVHRVLDRRRPGDRPG